MASLWLSKWGITFNQKIHRISNHFRLYMLVRTNATHDETVAVACAANDFIMTVTFRFRDGYIIELHRSADDSSAVWQNLRIILRARHLLATLTIYVSLILVMTDVPWWFYLVRSY